MEKPWAHIGDPTSHPLTYPASGPPQTEAAMGTAGGQAEIEGEEDSLTLLDLSITETDTTLVSPLEFGVLDRFDLDREVGMALQEGLPLGAAPEVALAAAERD